MKTISDNRLDAATLRDWLSQSNPVTLIDVRGPAEFETVHIPGAVNVPVDVVEGYTEVLAARLGGTVVLMCQSGPRSEAARRCLDGVGADSTLVLDGGIAAYIAAGGDVVRGRATWSLERQVRLLAGSLVLTGLVAGLRLPKARLLSGFIGAGLVVSATTNTCTMGRVLASLPYNRGPRDRTPAEVLAQLPSHREAA